MTAPLPLIRKFYALTNRLEDGLKRVRGGSLINYFDPIDAIPWFEKWVKIRAELTATEPELDDIPVWVVPTPARSDDPRNDHQGRGYIKREAVIRMSQDIKSVWDILNHPSRSVVQVSIDREGIFVAGQPFDAMLAITSIVRAASKSITIVDGYVSDQTLSLLSVKADAAAAMVLTYGASAALIAAAKAFNAQYGAGPPIEVRTSKAFHDRFIIVDETDCYHFGTSLKDAAKKNAFMFSRIEEPSMMVTLKAEIAKQWAAATVVAL